MKTDYSYRNHEPTDSTPRTEQDVAFKSLFDRFISPLLDRIASLEANSSTLMAAMARMEAESKKAALTQSSGGLYTTMAPPPQQFEANSEEWQFVTSD